MANTYSVDLEESSSEYLYITDGNQTGLDLSTDFTFEFWLKIEALPSTHNYCIISKDSGAGQDSYTVWFDDATTELRVQYKDASANKTQWDSDAAALVAGDVGNWRHFVITADISAASISVYKASPGGSHSAIAGAMSSTAATTIRNSTAQVNIGEFRTSGWYYDGRIDDFRVWSDIRTTGEMDSNFEQELVGNEANLVAYWKFENNGNDTTSNNNDLSVSGTPTYELDPAFVGATTSTSSTSSSTSTSTSTSTSISTSSTSSSTSTSISTSSTSSSTSTSISTSTSVSTSTSISTSSTSSSVSTSSTSTSSTSTSTTLSLTTSTSSTSSSISTSSTSSSTSQSTSTSISTSSTSSSISTSSTSTSTSTTTTPATSSRFYFTSGPVTIEL